MEKNKELNDEELDNIAKEIKIFSNNDKKLKFLGKILNNDSSRAIIQLLIEKEMTANEIALQTKLSLPLALHHINQMIQAEIVTISKTENNSKNQPMKYYSAKSGIVILPEKASIKAKESKSFSNSLKKVMKFASVGVTGIASWFSIRYVQFQQNMQSDSEQLGYEYVEGSSFDWFAIDSTGVKVANRGEWMRQKRRGFLKIHVAVDVKSKQITGLEITDDKSHDSKSFISLVEQSKKFGNVIKALADGAYDNKDNFSYLYHDGIIPGIKTRNNSSVNTNCYPRRKSVLAQIFNYDLWKNSVRYGSRWIAESVFSAFKRMFGEHVTSHKRENMIVELKMKVCLYNKMIAMQ